MFYRDYDREKDQDQSRDHLRARYLCLPPHQLIRGSGCARPLHFSFLVSLPVANVAAPLASPALPPLPTAAAALSCFLLSPYFCLSSARFTVTMTDVMRSRKLTRTTIRMHNSGPDIITEMKKPLSSK
mmetsp:Transcript_17600/g.43607  ORF Transcript_17600/g.43607 Transcript_17600/m.43607 type:complete len:128 (-) Transcript_17600:412-795(-)